MMAINMIDVFRFDSILRHTAYRRKQLSKAYKYLGKDLGVEIKKYVNIYNRSIDSVFTAVQELKISGTTNLIGFGSKNLPQNILFPDAITELKTYIFCEKANIL
jgi:hypothetical protein